MEEQQKKKRTYDLEDRLIRFSAKIGELVPKLVTTLEGNTIRNQLIRSGTSPALNYAEALVPESTADFIHKISICLKELKETRVNLKLIILRKLSTDMEQALLLESECSELVAIFIASVKTARKNAAAKQKQSG